MTLYMNTLFLRWIAFIFNIHNHTLAQNMHYQLYYNYDAMYIQALLHTKVATKL